MTYGRPERALIFLHRWFGIVLALLMLLWTVSGIVMLYVAFPALSDAERYAGLDPVRLPGCCASSAATALEGYGRVDVTMLEDAPVARVDDGNGGRATLDLVTGEWVDALAPATAANVAAGHLRARGIVAADPEVEVIDNDQWTVYRSFHAHRPLYKVAFDSPRGDVLYVSGTSGEVVQDTHARERFWNWLGAVPHWLYYTSFRERQPLWYRVVVWTSLFGTLLAASGLYLGIRRTFQARRRLSPYFGPMKWHHVSGLLFGVLTLTWVLSGLASMNPWGWLDSDGGGMERVRAEGEPLDAATIGAWLERIAAAPAGPYVEMSLQATVGGSRVTGVDATGRRVRMDPESLEPAPVAETDIQNLLGAMRPDAAIAEFSQIGEEDSYYFGHKGDVVLPVYRAILDDDERTRYYFHPATGELLARFDAPARQYRWWHHGLHRLDLTAALRSRPLWDIVMLPLLVGVATLCAVGCWVGWRHLTRRQA